MWLDALLAYLHYLSIIGMGAHLALEFALLRRELRGDSVARLARVDLSYFAAAIAALVTGLLRVFYGAKGPAFYTANPVLYAKVGLFLIVGLLSIAPTLTFIRWAREARHNPGYVPAPAVLARTQRLVGAELLLFSLLPLLAVMLARGIGIG
jgi:putative membrane protein